MYNDITGKPIALRGTFALLSLLTIAVISVVSSYLLSRFLSEHLLERDAAVSAEFIQSVARINNPEPYFRNSSNPEDRSQLQEFFHHITLIPGVLGATVYGKDESVLWSNDQPLIGQRFDDQKGLQRALSGELLFQLSTANEHDKAEHQFLSPQISEFVESYIPIWDAQSRSVIGVVELYKTPDALFSALSEGRWLVIGISAIGAALLYLILFGIVHRAAGTIERQREELQRRIQQLSQLLTQNRELSQRVQSANRRAIELNEQFLRQVGVELQDGPAQGLGFALLRLDAIKQEMAHCHCEHLPRTPPVENEIDTIRGALQESMQQIRSLSAGLAVPELDGLSLTKALQRAVRSYCQRHHAEVDLQLDHVPEQLPSPLKICAYRAIQQGLNNASRFVHGQPQRVEVHGNGATLQIAIIDDGDSSDSEQTIARKDDEKPGIAGLRELIQSLGGDFQINRSLGLGTRLNIILPLDDPSSFNA